MKLVSMRRPKKTKKEREAEYPLPMEDEQKYPYGLEIRLETEEIKKLGLENLTQGEGVVIQAKGAVTRTESVETNGSTRRSLSIQIKELGIRSTESFDQAFEEAAEGK